VLAGHTAPHDRTMTAWSLPQGRMIAAARIVAFRARCRPPGKRGPCDAPKALTTASTAVFVKL
jgi:hypothetical protein